MVAVILCILFLPLSSVFAETYQDDQHHFKVSYGDEWQLSTAISATIKFSLISKERAPSRRPLAIVEVSVRELDTAIPLKKYIRNNIKIASVTWTLLEEKSLPSLGDDNRLMIMERNMGRHSQKVYKLLVKDQSNVYETSCAMAKIAESTFESSCRNIIESFQLIK